MNRLSPRLAALAALARKDALFVDVGSDHGYLPLFLLQKGTVKRAIATDLRAGPLSSARAHACLAAANDSLLLSRLSFLVTDGLDGLKERILPEAEPLSSPPALCDIAIAGMGGELIVSILKRASFVLHPSVRLLLQPMTKPEAVRRYLREAGFAVLEERLAAEGTRLYQLFAAGPKEARPDDDRREGEKEAASAMLLADYLGERDKHPPEELPLYERLAARLLAKVRRENEARKESGREEEQTLLLAQALEEELAALRRRPV